VEEGGGGEEEEGVREEEAVEGGGEVVVERAGAVELAEFGTAIFGAKTGEGEGDRKTEEDGA